MNVRSSLACGSSLLVAGIGAVAAITQPALACSTNVTGTATVTGSTSCVNWNGSGSFTINSGVVLGTATPALAVSTSSGTVINNGTIQGGGYAITVGAGSTLTRLTNNSGGTITASTTAVIQNLGNIGTISNQGMITTANGRGIDNSGTITSIINNAQINSNSNAIYNAASGSIGSIANTGVIAGNITNLSANNLSISGGSGSTFGLLTGYNGGSASTSSPGTLGAISNTSSNLVLVSGNIWLNDTVDVTGHTLSATSATVKLSNAVAVTGAYSQTGGGLLIAATGNGASYGYLSATGNATVSNSTITISGSGLTRGQTFTIVRAGGTGTYTNDTAVVAITSGLAARLSTVGQNLVVTLGGGSYAATATAAGGSSSSIGATLDNINSATSPSAVAFQNTVLSVLDALPTAAQGPAIRQLAPTQNAPPSQMSTVAVAAVLGAVEQHQQTAMAYDPETGAAAGSEANDSALWGQFLGCGAQRDTNARADGYSLKDFGMAVGMDHRFTPNAMGGVALSWVRAWSQGRDGSSGSLSTMDSYQLTFYGTYRMDRAFVDGQLGGGLNHFDQKRAIQFLGSTASATYDGQQYLAKAMVGYDIPAGYITVTPLASLRWLRSVTGSYDETGAGAANLSIDRRGTNSISQDLGGKVSWSVPTTVGELKSEARLAWVHDYTDSPIAASGVMGGQAFAVNTPRTVADGVRVGLAAALNGDDALSFRVEYEGELRAQYRSHTGAVKAIWGF